MMPKRMFHVLSVVVPALLFGAAAQGSDTIKIGSFVSASGPASFLGDPELKTLQLYIDKINAAGGVAGKKLQLVHYDDAGNAEQARTFAKRLIESDKVDLIIGGSTTGTTMAAVPLVEQAETPFISMAGAVVITSPVKKWVFKTPPTDRQAAQKIFEDMKKRGITKIGLISSTDGFGKSGHDQSLDVAPGMGIEIIADETYGPRDTDMTAQLTKIRNTPGVQAVLNFGFGQGPAIVTKNYRQLGIDLPFYQSHGVASDSFLELAGPAAEGLRLPSGALLVGDQLKADDPQRDVVLGYINEYQAKYGSAPSTFGGYAYDALMIAVDAIGRAGSADKAAIRDAIESTTGLVGTSGIFNMTPEDHSGLDLSAFHMLEVKDGKWKIVE
ncbi:MAG: ABC transporter substrate-binding protein [Rhodospirillales bacterium]